MKSTVCVTFPVEASSSLINYQGTGNQRIVTNVKVLGNLYIRFELFQVSCIRYYIFYDKSSSVFHCLIEVNSGSGKFWFLTFKFLTIKWLLSASNRLSCQALDCIFIIEYHVL